MRCFTKMVGLIGFSIAVVLGSCGVLESTDIGQGNKIKDATVGSSSSGNGMGGAGGSSGTAGGGGAGGGGGAESPCGNGQLESQSDEECDDGNKQDGDGCDSQCRKNPCYDCNIPGTLCSKKMMGSECMGSMPNMFCDSSGKCVDHCKDGVHNPNIEDGPDCGKECLACNGTVCTSVDGSDCASTFCVDGYCCNSKCNSECKTCNLPMQKGMCKDVFAGIDDDYPVGICVGGIDTTCDGNGSCYVPADNKLENGQNCSDGMSGGDINKCASNFCNNVMGTFKCGKDTGALCILPKECASGDCKADGKCQ